MQNEKYILGLVAVAAIVLCISIGYIIPGSPIKAALNGGPTATAIPSATATALPTVSNTPQDQAQSNQTQPDITSLGVGLSKAIASAIAYPQATAWLNAHPGAQIVELYTDHMDTNGNAMDWHIGYISNGEVLNIVVQSGIVSRCYNYTGSTRMPAMDANGLADSSTIMKSLIDNSAYLNLNKGSSPFSFYLQPESGTYNITYVDNVNNNGFTASFDAKSGALLENGYKGVVS